MVPMKKGLAIGLCVIFFLLAGAAVAVAAYDHARRDVIAPGVRVAGVPVGGLHAAEARARVRAALRAPPPRPLGGDSRDRHWTLSPARAHAAVDPDALVARAVADSREGSVVPRTLH